MPKHCWTPSKILENILELPENKRYSTYVKQTNGALWKAAQRHFGSWKNAIEAADMNYEKVVKWGPRKAYNKGAGGLCTFPGCSKKHHANDLCQHHDNMMRYKLKQERHI
jgi:hypothetical protein